MSKESDRMIKDLIVECPKEIENIVLNYKNMNKKENTISAVIICRDEEEKIKRCITSVEKYVNEIVIVDTGSIDRTIEIIESIDSDKIKLYSFIWNDDFSEARNFSISKATGEWLLLIDSDEYLSSNCDNIVEILEYFDGCEILEKIVFSPKIIDVNGDVSIRIPRLFKKNNNLKYFGNVHEEIRIIDENNQTYIKPYNVTLNIEFMHDGYTAEIMNKKDKINRNLLLLKKMMLKEPNNVRWLYFYLRDGLNETTMEEFESIMRKAIFIEEKGSLKMENLKIDSFTYPIISNYIVKMLNNNYNREEIEKVIDIYEQLSKCSYNATFFRTVVEINEIKLRMGSLLLSLMDFRNGHFETQYNAFHTEGKHVDLMIGYLLFQLGHVEKAKKYYDYIGDAMGENNRFVKEYRETIKTIMSLYNE